MPSINVAEIAGAVVALDLNATSTQVIGLIITGLVNRAIQVTLLDDDGITPVRTITVASGIGDRTVSLTPPQRRLFTVAATVNTRGEPVVIMTRPFYLIEGI